MKIESLYRYPVKGLTPGTPGQRRPHPRPLHPLGPRLRSRPGRCQPRPRPPRLGRRNQFHVPAAQCQNRPAENQIRRCHPASYRHHAGRRNPQASPLTPEGQASLTEFFTAYLGDEARYGPDGQKPPLSTISKITVFATTKPRSSASSASARSALWKQPSGPRATSAASAPISISRTSPPGPNSAGSAKPSPSATPR